jgi:hypothetical protein
VVRCSLCTRAKWSGGAIRACILRSVVIQPCRRAASQRLPEDEEELGLALRAAVRHYVVRPGSCFASTLTSGSAPPKVQ